MLSQFGFRVPVPVPYRDHKKHGYQKNLRINLAFSHSKLFYKEKIDMLKKYSMTEMKYTILDCVFVRTFVIPF